MQKLIYRWLLMFILLYVFFVVDSFSDNTLVQVSIVPWQITLGFPAYLNLWTINLSQSPTEVEWQFGDYFWVSDLGGSDNGYRTTIVSDGLIWNNWVTLTGIYLIAWNNWAPELLLWVDWDVRINTAFLGSGQSIFSNPVTYIYRPQWINYWRINKYGDKPSIRIVLPPYSQPWQYSWTIYFDI